MRGAPAVTATSRRGMTHSAMRRKPSSVSCTLAARAPREWRHILAKAFAEHIGTGADDGAGREHRPDGRLRMVADEAAEELAAGVHHGAGDRRDRTMP